MNSNQKSIFFWIIFIIIAVIAAIIVFPKYGPLSKSLRSTQARSLAANLTSSSAANYTLRKSNPTMGFPIKNCVDVVNITGNHLPSGYEISDQAIASDAVANCVLKGPDIAAVHFSVIGIS